MEMTRPERGEIDRTSLHLFSSDGPVGYRSSLPLEDWAARNCVQKNLPAAVSFNAGTLLLQLAAVPFLAGDRAAGLRTEATFLHVPLDTSQVVSEREGYPSMPPRRQSE